MCTGTDKPTQDNGLVNTMSAAFAVKAVALR
jgi:hypothetical protein